MNCPTSTAFDTSLRICNYKEFVPRCSRGKNFSPNSKTQNPEKISTVSGALYRSWYVNCFSDNGGESEDGSGDWSEEEGRYVSIVSSGSD